jgi:hypothetical protein
MHRAPSALTCLEAVLELDQEDMDGLVKTMRTDPDLAALRSGPALEELIGRCA